MSKARTSAGFLIRSKDKFLLCHATRKKDDKPQQFDGNWTISKGMVESNEQPIDAAVRELREETNIELNEELARKITDVPLSKFEPFTSYKTSDKKVLVFLLDDKKGVLIESKLDLKCTSLISNPPNSRVAYLNGLPEMDAFMWVSREEAIQMVYKSQQFLFEKDYIEKKLAEANKSLENSMKNMKLEQ